MKKRAVIFLNRDHRLNSMVIEAISGTLEVSKVLFQKDPSPSGAELEGQGIDFVFNFLCDRIHKESVLRLPNINFHPGTPDYPGRGGATLVLFDGRDEYGATSHQMVAKVDAGAIFDIEKFPISAEMRCDQVFELAEDACFRLLLKCLKTIDETGSLPRFRSELTWSRSATSRAQFQKWLILDPQKPEEFQRKIRASRHIKYPGPYLIVHGQRFAYVGSDKT